MPTGNPLFRQTEQDTDVRAPRVAAPDRAQAILQEGAAAAQLTGAIGQIAAAPAVAYQKKLERDDNNDRLAATTEIKQKFDEYKIALGYAKTKKQAKKLQDDFLKAVSQYGSDENPSGERKLRTQSIRDWFSTQYAPGVKSAAQVAHTAKEAQINEADNLAKYRVSRKHLMSMASSPQEVDNSMISLAELNRNNLSKEQAAVQTKEDRRQMGYNSIANQADFMMMASDYYADDAEATAKALIEQTRRYDFTPEQQKQLESKINSNVQRIRTRDITNQNMAKSQLKAERYAAEQEIYGVYREINTDRTNLPEKVAQARQLIDDAPFSEKEKLAEEQRLAKLSAPKLDPSDPRALAEIDRLSANPNIPNEKLQDELHRQEKAGKVNPQDAANISGQLNRRAKGEQKKVLNDFLMQFKAPLTLGKDITLREIEVDWWFDKTVEIEAPKSVQKRNQLMTNLSHMAQKWQQANPNATVSDFNEKFQKDIVDVMAADSEVKIEDAILKSLRTTDVEVKTRAVERKIRGMSTMQRVSDRRKRLKELLNRRKQQEATKESE